MRRTAMAVIGMGCAVGVLAGTSPASAGTAGRSGSSPNASGAVAAAGRLKTVQYDGYSIAVPSSWPVFDLDTDPAQCVRYDINAVYLGSPGADQNCLPHLVGRAETITISDTGGPAAPQPGYGPAAGGGLGTGVPAGSAGSSAGSVPAALSGLDQYSQEQEFQGAVAHSSLSVTGTYGGDASQVESIIRGIRKLPATAGGAPARDTAAGTGGPARTRLLRAVRSRASARAPSPRARVPSRPLDGFDTCTAPSLGAMHAWRARYSAAAVYIGGLNMACDYGNLSASWVRSAHSMGWSLLPVYVGLQAPCNSFSAKIDPRYASHQARGAADTAINDAINFGMRRGTPIYFDMEGYNTSNAACSHAVLTFLDAWTRELHDHGYVSGVYSSASAGIAGLVRTSAINAHPFAEPDAVWFALWDGHDNLLGAPYVPARRWAHDRDKQYAGNQRQRNGGYTLGIDCDRVYGAVSAPLPGGRAGVPASCLPPIRAGGRGGPSAAAHTSSVTCRGPRAARRA